MINDKDQMVSFVAPRKLWNDFKAISDKKGIPASQLLRDLMRRNNDAYFKRAK